MHFNTLGYTMPNDFIEIRLKKCPPDIDYLIKKEQHRLAFMENKDFKKEEVVYEMLREWYKLKSNQIIESAEKTLETACGTLNLDARQPETKSLK